MVKFVKRLICKYKGHKWETYIVSTGYWGNDIEQAGYCVRCGHDTHGEYQEYSVDEYTSKKDTRKVEMLRRIIKRR